MIDRRVGDLKFKRDARIGYRESKLPHSPNFRETRIRKMLGFGLPTIYLGISRLTMWKALRTKIHKVRGEKNESIIRTRNSHTLSNSPSVLNHNLNSLNFIPRSSKSSVNYLSSIYRYKWMTVYQTVLKFWKSGLEYPQKSHGVSLSLRYFYWRIIDTY
jgi:hypothetical protein